MPASFQRFSLLIVLGVFILLSALPAHAAKKQMRKYDLWRNGPHLRGVNIWNARSHGILVQTNGLPVGPEHTQHDMNTLAGLGANLVLISHAGLFDEQGRPDKNAEASLDQLLDRILKADMFAVIAFRSGPGRCEFTFNRHEVGDWFQQKDLDETLWGDLKKQRQWAQMWKATARRYKGHPAVVGYTLMVEPNGNELAPGLGDGAWEPKVFYGKFRNTSYDWNQFYPKLVTAIRQEDSTTPIIIPPNSYADVNWLPYLTPSNDPYAVYDIHAYGPYKYSTQIGGPHPYPGKTLDLNHDGAPDQLDKRYLENMLRPASTFLRKKRPVAALEFGARRHAPGVGAYIRDMCAQFERLGINYAIWSWTPGGFSIHGDVFTIRRGPDLNEHSDRSTTAFISALKPYFAKNTLRPSTVSFVDK